MFGRKPTKQFGDKGEKRKEADKIPDGKERRKRTKGERTKDNKTVRPGKKQADNVNDDNNEQ